MNSEEKQNAAMRMLAEEIQKVAMASGGTHEGDLVARLDKILGAEEPAKKHAPEPEPEPEPEEQHEPPKRSHSAAPKHGR